MKERVLGFFLRPTPQGAGVENLQKMVKGGHSIIDPKHHEHAV